MKNLLSVVINCRNDNYHENFIDRLSGAINLNLYFLDKINQKNKIKFVISDWGSEEPISNKINIYKDFIENVDFVNVKKKDADELSLKQPGGFYPEMSANLGIRKSNGQFILYTGADQIFSKSGWLNLINLLEGKNKFDFEIEDTIFYVPRKFIDLNFFRKGPSIYMFERYIDFMNFSALPFKQPTFYKGGGYSTLCSKKIFHQLKGFDENYKPGAAADVDFHSRIKKLSLDQIDCAHLGITMFKFEKSWSKWLGCKYSVFVNSGSSANLLTISCLKYLNKNKLKNEIIVPPLAWSSDINSVILNGFKPIFVDINEKTLSIDPDKVIKKINKKTLAVFITHAQGFNGFNERFLEILKKKKIFLIEDVCESHGATHKGKKLGTFGLISNFSFYYAHHMTTIEGGMISTNDRKIYEILRSLRSHGLVREMNNKKLISYYRKKYSDLSDQFIFLYPGYNLRNTEIGAVLGINQLKNLDKNINLRNLNLKYFLKNLDNNIYQTNFNLEGVSSYAFPLVLKKPSFLKRNKLEKVMNRFKIEFRRGNAGGGNQLRQPYIKKYLGKINLKNFEKVEHIHHFGYYIGNYPTLKKNKIKSICKILNSI